MMEALLELVVAKKGDTSIRVDAETAEVLRQLASLRNISIGEYLRRDVLPIARRALISEARKIVKQDKTE